jgi:hypothetical protein
MFVSQWLQRTAIAVKEILLNHGFEFYLKSFRERRTQSLIKSS